MLKNSELLPEGTGLFPTPGARAKFGFIAPSKVSFLAASGTPFGLALTDSLMSEFSG